MISNDATVQSRSLPDGTWSLQWVHGAPSWLFSSTWLFLTQNWWWLLTRNRWETSNHQFVAAVKTVILTGTWCTCLSKRHFLLTLAPDLCVCGSFESLHFLENIKVWHLIVITILIDQGQFFAWMTWMTLFHCEGCSSASSSASATLEPAAISWNVADAPSPRGHSHSIQSIPSCPVPLSTNKHRNTAIYHQYATLIYVICYSML